jgi:hypothetical protein
MGYGVCNSKLCYKRKWAGLRSMKIMRRCLYCYWVHNNNRDIKL